MLAAALALSLTTCPIDAASYRLDGAPGIEASFVVDNAGERELRLKLVDTRSGVTYTALVVREGAGAGPALHLYDVRKLPGRVPVGDWVLSEQKDLFLLTRQYGFDDDFSPRSARMAPARLFVPGLQSLFWYGDMDHRVSVPLALFDLRSCDRPSTPPR